MALVHTPASTSEGVRSALVAVGSVVLALLVLYLIGLDQGAVSRTGMFLHELMHDGRHLLGVPCH
jgi:hypothetical protein